MCRRREHRSTVGRRGVAKQVGNRQHFNHMLLPTSAPPTPPPPPRSATPRIHLSAQGVRPAADAQHGIAAALGCTVVGRAGSGFYGSVLLARRRADGASVALKLAPHPAETLAIEARVLEQLRGTRGFPVLYAHEVAPGGTAYDALVMERLGASIHDTWERETAGTHLAGPTVLRLGRGALRCLRALHAAGYVHNDVKPANVLFGAPDGARAAAVHLIDFGLATSVHGAQVGRGAPFGTPLFASAAAHAGAPTRPVHDVESLVYALAYLAQGGLPWARKRPARAAALKRRMLAEGTAARASPRAVASARLTEGVHDAATAQALHAVWQQVAGAYEAPPGRRHVDYDACLAALGAEEAGGTRYVV